MGWHPYTWRRHMEWTQREKGHMWQYVNADLLGPHMEAYERWHLELCSLAHFMSCPELTIPCEIVTWHIPVRETHFGGTPNLHFPHLHQTQIYTNPKFTQDPNLHKPRFTRDPYLHSPDLHKSIFAHRFQETQIYTKSIFTQHNFTQNPNLQKTASSNFASNYIKWIPLSTLVSSKKTMPLEPQRRAALEV